MLDRKSIKGDVKGILGGTGKGTVFLATLLVFIIGLVYFGAVWGVSQFYPVTQADVVAIGNYMNEAAQTASTETGKYEAISASIAGFPASLTGAVNNINMIYLLAFVIEIIIILPLGIGVQKFMLRFIRLKNPGAGTVLKGYTGSYFFRSILLPFWRGLCLMGWQIIAAILTCGIFAGIALATGLKVQDFAALNSNITAESINGIFSAEYLAQNGWIYTTVLSVWSLLTQLFMAFKMISYSLSGMALAERPQMGVRKALRASRRITRKNHFRLFIVSLSFIGWYLLLYVAAALVIALGVGLNMLNMGQLGLIITLAVALIVILLCMYLFMPYRVGVHAECYVQLKRAALESGVVIREDFRGKHELNSAAADDQN